MLFDYPGLFSVNECNATAEIASDINLRNQIGDQFVGWVHGPFKECKYYLIKSFLKCRESSEKLKRVFDILFEHYSPYQHSVPAYSAIG